MTYQPLEVVRRAKLCGWEVSKVESRVGLIFVLYNIVLSSYTVVIMASTYFTIPSFARAKKNKEDLEKKNPQEPVLNDEDEKFLEKQLTTDEVTQQSKEIPAAKIADDGEEKEATKEEQEQAGGSVVVPETTPGTGDGTQEIEKQETEQTTEPKPEQQSEEASYDDVMKEKAAERVKARKAKRNKSFDLPSQEEAEAATKGFPTGTEQDTNSSPTEKRPWSSYLSNATSKFKKADTTSPPGSSDSAGDGRTWGEYASTYVPSMPNVSLPNWMSKDKDSQHTPVYNEDGTVNEEATKEQQEREVSVLLDNLNLSSINNRVFAFSAETQKIYERFAQCLKDIINGVPTAYDDMDKLMKEAGPKLEAQFKSMPPFVQTLVKSLPMRLGSTLGPELMAAASEKPGADMKSRLAAASQPGASGAASSGINLASSTTTEKAEDGTVKKKRRIPGLKSLVGEKSAVATMLRSCVSFLQTRFPFLVSTTNVAMSLAVFSKFSLCLATHADGLCVCSLVGD